MQSDWDNFTLNLQDCPHITRLPELRYESLHELDITDCPQLTSLPANLRVSRLIIERCPRLEPSSIDVIYAGSVSSAGDASLAALPDGVFVSETLNLSGSE